ncbi:unnamed protein product [Chilo suppressalis]|uniref:Uncharacterized protein n=1 Tax=Chilo suppressalis TaxID=168631 RepID=A0ABN8AUZ6_CHISP|nr:unnamed protein product [Chilo suppressalis]
MTNFIFMILILILVLYSYTTTQNQFAATASALRQIWSGGCPLSCRHSDYSYISGLSSRPESQTGQCRNLPLRHAHTFEGCACENCPCALIENFISSCRPASTMYNQFMNCTTNCIDYLMQMLTNEISTKQNSKENIRIQKNRDEKENLFDKRNYEAGSSGPFIKTDEKDDKKKITKDKKERDDIGAQSKNEKPSNESSEVGILNRKGKKVSNSHPSLCGRNSDNTIEYEPTCSAAEAPSQNNGCSKCLSKGRTCVKDCPKATKKKSEKIALIDSHLFCSVSEKSLQVVDSLICSTINALYEGKLKVYSVLSKYDRNDYCRIGGCGDDVIYCEETGKDDIDRVIEDELTQKLGEDLLQSIQKKFEVDLERSVDMVLMKIKLLLQNGTEHIQEKLEELQTMLETMKKTSENDVDACLNARQNETSALAEKALHQMVVCGYALIGHDPAEAVRKVLTLKTMISSEMKPLHDQKQEVLGLLKVCGHDHDSLKKVIKCVISKAPAIKTTMMDITGKLIDGVVTLTKLMAHGAMHEACLIEVIKTTEDEAFQLVKETRKCVDRNKNVTTQEELDKYIKENNATILDINLKKSSKTVNNDDKDLKDVIRRMLAQDDVQDLYDFKKKFKGKIQDGEVANKI